MEQLYRNIDELSTRNAARSEEIQLRIDLMHADLDDHQITGLHGQVRQLKNVRTPQRKPLKRRASLFIIIRIFEMIVSLKFLICCRYKKKNLQEKKKRKER